MPPSRTFRSSSAGPREHGNVTGQSASDSRAIAARHHSRAPSGSSAALSKPGRFIAARTAMVAPTRRAQKRTGSPDCKGVTGATAGKTRTMLHRPFPSIGYARRLGLFGSTSEVSARGPVRRRTAPTGNRTTEGIKGGLSLRNCLQSHRRARNLGTRLARQHGATAAGRFAQRRDCTPNHAARRCGRFHAKFRRNIAIRQTLSLRGDFAFLNRFKEDRHAEETHDHDGHHRPDDRRRCR